ncbi:MAG: ABC transporter substrate-binding protein [Firmicutes bacterium]|nr:ABC transporter substrate-binding protein [Bacillota bacterium]
MKRKSIRLLALLLCIAMLAGCGAKSGDEGKQGEWTPVTVTDDLGREVTIDAEPQAVAAIMGSFADTWVLAGGTLKAAVHDAWEDFGLDLGDDAVDLGKYNAINLEQLFGAEVDLVLASANTKKQVDIKDTLESAGVKVLYFNVNSFGDYLRMLKICTDITGRADLYEQNGTAIKEQVDAAIDKAKEMSASKGVPKILFVRAAASTVKAKGSDDTVLGIMLKDLCCNNIADGSGLLEDLSIEKIIEEDPDMIFITQQGSDSEGAMKALEDALTGNPAWAGLTAVKEGRVHMMDKSLYHLKPNARWGEAYEKLEAMLYGE